MYSVRTYLISVGLLLSVFILYPSVSFASEYALAMAGYFDGKCKVIIWIHGESQSKKIEYQGEPNDTLCNVNVPNKEFEKNFKYCLLSGIKVKGESKPFIAEFGGGPAGDRDIYWFTWEDARYVFPNFSCFLK